MSSNELTYFLPSSTLYLFITALLGSYFTLRLFIIQVKVFWDISNLYCNTFLVIDCVHSFWSQRMFTLNALHLRISSLWSYEYPIQNLTWLVIWVPLVLYLQPWVDISDNCSILKWEVSIWYDFIYSNFYYMVHVSIIVSSQGVGATGVYFCCLLPRQCRRRAYPKISWNHPFFNCTVWDM